MLAHQAKRESGPHGPSRSRTNPGSWPLGPHRGPLLSWREAQGAPQATDPARWAQTGPRWDRPLGATPEDSARWQPPPLRPPARGPYGPGGFYPSQITSRGGGSRTPSVHLPGRKAVRGAYAGPARYRCWRDAGALQERRTFVDPGEGPPTRPSALGSHPGPSAQGGGGLIFLNIS